MSGEGIEWRTVGAEVMCGMVVSCAREALDPSSNGGGDLRAVLDLEALLDSLDIDSEPARGLIHTLAIRCARSEAGRAAEE